MRLTYGAPIGGVSAAFYLVSRGLQLGKLIEAELRDVLQ